MEALEIGKSLEALESKAAKSRMIKAGKLGRQGCGTCPHPSGHVPEGSKGRVRDKIGAALGMSGTTYERLKSASVSSAIYAFKQDNDE